MDIVVRFPAATELAGSVTLEPPRRAILLERGKKFCKIVLYGSNEKPYTFTSVALLSADGFVSPVEIVVNEEDVGTAPLQKVWPTVHYAQKDGLAASVAIIEMYDQKTDEALVLDRLDQSLAVKLRFSK